MAEYETYYSLDGGRTWKFAGDYETYAEACDRAFSYFADGARAQVRMFSGRILTTYPANVMVKP